MLLKRLCMVMHDTFENLPNPHSEVNIIFADYHYACIRSDRHFLFFIITLLIEILGISKFFLRHFIRHQHSLGLQFVCSDLYCLIGDMHVNVSIYSTASY